MQKQSWGPRDKTISREARKTEINRKKMAQDIGMVRQRLSQREVVITDQN